MKFHLRPLAAALFTILVALPAATSARAQSFNGNQRTEIEGIIREYLLSHPELMQEVMNELDKRQATADAEKHRTAVSENSATIFTSPRQITLGNPQGDVTLVEFFDYNCPYCRQMAPLMVQAEGEDPQLRIVYKEFPILGPGSVVAAKAALAANKQGKYVAFHRALYQIRGPVEESKVLDAAATIGLDVDRLKADMQDPTIAGVVDRNLKLAQALRISGTPGFVIGDQILVGASDLKTLQAVLQTVRGRQQATK